MATNITPLNPPFISLNSQVTGVKSDQIIEAIPPNTIIQLDNVIECQQRLKSLFYERLAMLHVKPFDYFVGHVLINNIRLGNALEDTFSFLDVKIIFKFHQIDIDVKKDSFCLTSYQCHLQQNTSQLQAVRLPAFEDEIGITRNAN
ncbi:hypothetical protein ACLSZY_05155 [Avibacterium volantium]|uniref:hypothetical protein n=1 Tax=Avibacterium TaxID=292486 RepID=UPI0039FBF50D